MKKSSKSREAINRGRNKPSSTSTALRRKQPTSATAPWHEAALFQKRQAAAVAASMAARDVLERSQLSRNSSKGPIKPPSATGTSGMSTSRSAATGAAIKGRAKIGGATGASSFGRMT